MGNYVIAGVGNYVIENPSNLGNYVIADTSLKNGSSVCFRDGSVIDADWEWLARSSVVAPVRGGGPARPVKVNESQGGGVALQDVVDNVRDHHRRGLSSGRRARRKPRVHAWKVPPVQRVEAFRTCSYRGLGKFGRSVRRAEKYSSEVQQRYWLR
jgi:hypothetical protein